MDCVGYHESSKHSSSSTRFLSTTDMKKWLAGGVFVFVSVLFLLRLEIFQEPSVQSSVSMYTNQSSHALNVHIEEALKPAERPQKIEEVSKPVEQPQRINKKIRQSPLFGRTLLNPNESLISTVWTWKYLKPAFDRPDMFPEGKQGLKEAEIAWQELMEDLRLEALDKGNNSVNRTSDNQCPYSVSSIDNKELQTNDFVLQVPCGLILDSSITIVGVSMGAEGDFSIELLGPKLPGELNPPIILHYNVRLRGDQLTETAVIVQNTWTRDQNWGEEERCPTDLHHAKLKVDGLDVCNEQVGKAALKKSSVVGESTVFKWNPALVDGNKKPWFPFVNGLPFAATLWAGWEGFHMTINGKHITSFEYRKNLEPSLASSLRLKGNLKPISVIANGLPASEDITQVADLQFLKAPPFFPKKKSELFIGVFSTGNNFDRRMAVRRSWMQYEAVRSGQVTVRFFVGLHSNEKVNKELWEEASTYGDIQLMPFVDYYNLITLKTIAICIFGVKMVNSKYIMKTDDDTFVRVNEILAVLNRTKHSTGLLYGSLEYEDRPNRDPDSKWYVSEEEWPHPVYPPWAHGPGYIISKDIAKFIIQCHVERNLKLFKLEDVSMGIWIKEYENQGHTIHYSHNQQFFTTGCFNGYVIAHYQNPRRMTCLWQKLITGSEPACCE